ncbi:Ig-like domain-containing protein [Methanobrevibacter sp.]|uniref:Ig-like domain-containing protein n=1 Tax=Methanobrevibacter sp. TaxID=66852 RepID=UPI0039760708
MKRNYLILLCLILFIVSIAAVSATEDVNQTDNLELSMNSNSEDKVDLDNNNGLDENDDLNKKLESDSNIRAMSKADKLAGKTIVVENFTFGDIQKAVNSATEGDTVYLKAGTYLNNENGQINIRQNNISIVGVKDSTILDAQKTSRIFNINTRSGITIKDIVFINGNADYGGAIYVFNDIDNVNIDATFINNTAKYYGGANYFNNAVSNMNSSGTYINNTANYGGANYFLEAVSNMNISGTYINNTANRSGGANCFEGAVSNVNSSGTYINNTAESDGGANYFHSVSNVNISGTYSNNTASNKGGANYFPSTVSDSDISGTYINNTADYGEANYFRNAVSNVNISGTYINNTANGTGLIYFNDNDNVGLNATISDAIFINNKCTDVIYVRTNGVVAYNNWFGNNATNYNEKPKNHNVNMINWLFLNATADSSRIGAGNSSKIAFVLQSYNETSDVGLYDASKMNINLTLSQTLGKLNKTSALIGEKITYTAKNVGNATITGKFETVSYTLSLTNTKNPTNITVANSTVDLKIGDVVDSGATLTPADAGNLTYTSSNTSVAIVEKGKIKALTNGTAVITVSFPGNENYTAAKNKTINVTVNLKDAIISVNNSTLDLFVGDNFTVVATTNPDGLKVTFVQDDSGVYIVDGNGNVTALKEGTGHILVKVGGDGVYAENTTEITVSVSKIPTEITLTNATLDLKVNEIVDGLANLTPADAGNLTFISSDEDIVFVADGRILTRGKGNANVTVSFAGNDKYEAALNKTIHVNVSLNDASVSVENDTLELKVDERYDLNATAVPSFLNVEYVSSNESVATVTDYGIVTAVGEGTTTITLTVGNDMTYAVNTTNVTVTVSKIPTEITVDTTPLDLFVGDEIVIVANLTPAGAGNVTFTSSDYDVVDFDFEGNVIAQGKGQAIITVSFAGDDKYAAAENKTIIINVSLDNASVTVDNNTLDLKVGETSAINATKHPDTIMLDITYTSSNNSVVTVDKKGIVTAVGEGTAVITVEVGDDEIYAKNSTTVNVTVSKVSTEIESSAVTTVYNVDKNLIVTLKDADGKPIRGANITVDLNGEKTYTTDKKGQITVSTKGLAPKAYTAKITFNGNSKYAKSTKDVKVTVKKATPKIAAKAKTFKTTTKTKKYSIVLKNNVNKPIKKATVYLKVNGKTYKATTNSKGKATFKITKLNKAGKFKATVTYKGNKYYNKATKKVTIKVKSVWKTVSKGSKNSAIVKKIQRALKNNGYYITYQGYYLVVDGIYGDCTVRSVKEFQNDKIIKVTGKVDEKTAKKLGII